MAIPGVTEQQLCVTDGSPKNLLLPEELLDWSSTHNSEALSSTGPGSPLVLGFCSSPWLPLFLSSSADAKGQKFPQGIVGVCQGGGDLICSLQVSQ